MRLTSWEDLVVHVELYAKEQKPTEGYARLLGETFEGRAHVSATAPGLVELRSEPDAPVTAADVAQALVEADLPAATVFERREWSVGRA